MAPLVFPLSLFQRNIFGLYIANIQNSDRCENVVSQSNEGIHCNSGPGSQNKDKLSINSADVQKFNQSIRDRKQVTIKEPLTYGLTNLLTYRHSGS